MRRMAKGLVRVLVAAFLLATASSARADQWTFLYSGNGGTDIASGVLTTTALSGGQATITGITGTDSGLGAITALVAPGGLGLNDNILYVPANPGFLDVAGLTYVAAGIDVNIFSDGGLGYKEIFSSRAPETIGTFTVAPVPEPATIALFGSGLVGVFLAKKRKKNA